MRINSLKSFIIACLAFVSVQISAKDLFPDGTPVPDWFRDIKVVNIKDLGTKYDITDYGVVNDSTILQTEKIQSVIDKVSQNGGGVIYIPKGTFLSGSLFFKPKTHLYIAKGGILKGSDAISDFKLIDTRMEGQNLKYFAALVNAIGNDGFTMSGEGIINGNGLRYWKEFWLRRQYNRKCTNLEAMRPRLVFISHSNNVQLSGLHFRNSPFWTTHLYKCENVKLLGLNIFAPKEPVKAPSSDAVDIDACKNVLVKNCYMSVNDDAVALKGGKGPWADKDPDNGSNENIIIEDCVYGFCHSALTCGSESLHDHNIIVRRCQLDQAKNLLWLKMRPDTPQNYEYITVEDIKGNASNFLLVKPWTQFFDLKGRKDTPYSTSSNVVMRNIDLECTTFFNVRKADDQYKLSGFTFENLNIKAEKVHFHPEYVDGFIIKNVVVNGKKLDK